MLMRYWTAGALGLLLLAGAGPARAQTLLRVSQNEGRSGLSGSADTLTLGLDLNAKEAAIEPTWGRGGGYRGWGGYHGGYRGYGWGGYRGYGWGGYRGYGWSGYRGWGWGGYRPYWGGYWAGYSPYYYGYSWYPYTYYYYAPPTYYYYWAPISVTASPSIAGDAMARPSESRVPLAAPQDRTYPYNGGPQDPVPQPKTAPEVPKVAPPPATVPMEGRTASLPTRPKYTYSAYGEEPGRSNFAQDRTTTLVNKK